LSAASDVSVSAALAAGDCSTAAAIRLNGPDHRKGGRTSDARLTNHTLIGFSVAFKQARLSSMNPGRKYKEWANIRFKIPGH
jgi:hypothetical protein